MKFIAIDPGEDTGYSVWEDGELVEANTEKMWLFADWLHENIEQFDMVICEDFRIYPWEAKNLSWDPVRTARLIGAITFICRMYGKHMELQPAKIKERAVAGGAESFFLKPLHENRHANDSIMHGVYWMNVHAKAPSGPSKGTDAPTQ